MASLIKRPGSPFWFAAFDVVQPDGSTRRLKKSTKKTKRAEALVEAMRLEDLERKGGVSSPETASKAYMILAEAAAAAAKGDLSEARARELLARISEASTGSPLQSYTVRTWAADWLESKATGAKSTTMARYRAHIETFLAWMGERADRRLEAVTKTEIRRFRDDIRAGWFEENSKVSKTAKGTKKPNPPRTAKTTNHYASDVAGMFRAAMREGLLISNPCAALDKLPENDSSEREVFSVAEVGSMVATAGDGGWQDLIFSKESVSEARSEDWQGMILVGFYVGARLGDCAGFTWANIDLVEKTLSFMPEKTSRKRKRLEVPLHPRLFSYLRDRNPSRDGPLFPSLAKDPIGGRRGLSAQFIAIMIAGGIDRRTVRAGESGGQRAQHARSFHALRHSLTSNLANLDVSEEIRRRIVGHESADVHAKYTHHERETLARALSKLPNV